MTDQSYMALHGATLAANGFRPIPILPGGKAPGQHRNGLWMGYPNWPEHCHRPTRDYEIETWSAWPNCGVGIACGNVIGIDIDVFDKPNHPDYPRCKPGEDDAACHAIEALAREMLGDTPAKRIGQAPKRMLLYRAAEPFGGMKRHPLEVLGTSNQFVAYAIHPDTQRPYEWPDGDLTTIDLDSLPVITRAQAEAFLERALPLVPPALRRAGLGVEQDGRNHSASSAGQRGTLPAITAALSYIPNADLHWDDWIRVGLALKGALGDDGRDLFESWSAQSSKNDVKLTRRQWRSFKPNSLGAATIYWLAEQAGWVPTPDLILNADVAEAAGDPHPAQDLIDMALARASASTYSRDVPADIMQPDGALGLFVDYATRTAFSPQPFLAIGAGLAVIGALAGRRYCSHSDLRTNVFVVGIAESGSGKDQARKCIRRLLVDAGLTQYLGGEQLASGQAIYGALEEFPSRVFLINEFGQMVASITGRNAGHKADILPNLTTLFTSASEFLPGKEYAHQSGQNGKKRVDYYQPHVCIYGDTVAPVLWRALQSGALSDGSIARWLVFQSPDDCPPYNRNQSPMDPPPELVDLFRRIAAGVPGHDYGGNLSSIMSVDTPMTPYRVPFGDGVMDEVDRLYDRQWSWKRDNLGTPATAFISRCAEHTISVAMIHAIGRCPEAPVIELRDLRWAQALVAHCLAAAIRETTTHVSDTVAEAHNKRVLDIIRKAGSTGLTRTDLYRATKFLTGRERASILADLVESGEVWSREEKTDGAGRPTIRYFATPGKSWRMQDND